MAEIRTFPFARHLRSEPTMHTLVFRQGRLVRSGRGLALWFRPLGTSIAEVPLDDRDIDVVIRARTSDFQVATVHGVVTVRPEDPAALADRIDFSLDPRSGAWRHAPLDRLASAVTRAAQQAVARFVAGRTLAGALEAGGEEPLRALLAATLAEDEQLADLGLRLVAVRVAAIRADADTERSLAVPTRERIQQAADQATFQRRAEAVESERAIAENELSNQIELRRREQQLVEQTGANELRAAEARAAESAVEADAEAARVRTVEAARLDAERQRAAILAGLTPAALLAHVLAEHPEAVPSVGQLVLAPDALTGLVGRLLATTADAEADDAR